MDLIDHVATQFTAAELTLVAERLGLAVTSRWSQKRLIEAIDVVISKNGIPEPPATDDLDQLAQAEILVEEYLFIAGYVDDKGNPLERKSAKIPLDEWMTLHNLTKKPDCYSFADDRDPACQRCLLYIYCAESRLAKLPPCFALLWDNNAPECSVCMDVSFCKEAVLAKGAKNGR